MNSLKHYKDQVYNLGSPSPTPSRSPLTSLPRNLETEFEFPETPSSKSKPKRNTNKTKIPKISSATKRKLECTEKTGSPPKKLKMMSEDQFQEYLKKLDDKAEQTKKETDELFAKNLAHFENRLDGLARDTDESITKGMSKFGTRLDGLAKKLDKVIDDNSETKAEVKSEFVNIKEQVSGLQTSVDTHRIKFENKLVILEGNFQQLSESVITASLNNTKEIKEALIPLVKEVKEEVSNSVKKDVKADILPPVRATWNAIQAQKVWEHEHSLLVFGFASSKSPTEAALDILKTNLKISEENMMKISVKKVIRLGKGDGNKIPPLLITFGHPSERNLALNHSKHLKGTKVTIKKSVPKNYQDEFKRFDDQSFKLRNMPGLDYQAQIVFDGHLMLLRTKLKDTTENKYHYTTYWTFDPPMETETDQKSNIKVPPGTKASPIPTTDVMSKANASIFMSVKDMTEDTTEDNFKTNLLAYLKEEHRPHVTDFKMKKKGLGIIFCNTWESANLIASTYKEKFMNHSVNFAMFCTKNPDNMQH
jgi:hypothetical protein